MNNEEISWVKQCLPEQLVYPFYKDRFALDILQHVFKHGTPIRELRSSNFGRLLQKKSAKEVLARCGDGVWNHNTLYDEWSAEMLYFRLTLDEWGTNSKWKKNHGYNQTSRPGKTLVLQVNFGGDHDEYFYRNIGKSKRDWFSFSVHPIHDKLNTFGWVRMDIDLERNEVLIEEVQSDWVRELKDMVDPTTGGFSDETTNALRRYNAYIKNYVQSWDEILVGAALWFIIHELGISTIWYHTVQSGNHYKMMPRYSRPPRSVYSKTPEKMGFRKVNEVPQILKDCASLDKLVRKGKTLKFYQLQLNN